MDGIIRIGDIKYEFEGVKGQFSYSEVTPESYDDEYEKYYIKSLDLVDNEEFHSKDELINSVSQRLGVSKDIIRIED